MYYRSFKIQGLFKANGTFSRPFQGKLKFKAFSRHPFKFKAFSSLCEPWKRDSISGFEITNPQFAKTGQQMSSADVTLDKKIAKHGGSKSNRRYRRPNSSKTLTGWLTWHCSKTVITLMLFVTRLSVRPTLFWVGAELSRLFNLFVFYVILFQVAHSINENWWQFQRMGLRGCALYNHSWTRRRLQYHHSCWEWYANNAGNIQ